MAVKILDEHLSGRLSDYLLGLEYVLEHEVQFSLNAWGTFAGDGGASRILLASVYSAAEKLGHFVIAAAGNDSVDLDAVDDYIPCIGGGSSTFPAPVNLLCTTSFDHRLPEKNYPLSKWANFGKRTVHVAFPGENILAPVPTDLQKQTALWDARNLERQNELGFFRVTGTSASSAHAASLVALLWSFRPGFYSFSAFKTFLLEEAVTKYVAGTSSDAEKLASGGRGNATIAMEKMKDMAAGNGAMIKLSSETTTTKVVTVDFADVNEMPGVIQGDFKVVLGQGGTWISSATEVRFYFLSEEDEVLGLVPLLNRKCEISDEDRDTTCSVSNKSNFTVTEGQTSSGVVMPPGTAKIAGYPVRSESDGPDRIAASKGTVARWPKGDKVEIPLKNIWTATEKYPSNVELLIPDDDSRENKARVRIRFEGAADEREIDSYNIYRVTRTGKKVVLTSSSPGGSDPAPLAVVPKKGMLGTSTVFGSPQVMAVESYIYGGREETTRDYHDSMGTGARIEIRNRGGYSHRRAQETGDKTQHIVRYQNNKYAWTVLKGPGTLFTEFLDLEENFDYLKIGQTILTGYYNRSETSSSTSPETSSSSPAPIAIPASRQVTISFRSDGNKIGDGFCLTWVPDLSYSTDVLVPSFEKFETQNADNLAVIPSWRGVEPGAEDVVAKAPRMQIDDRKLEDGSGGGGLPPSDPALEPDGVQFWDEDMRPGFVNGTLNITTSKVFRLQRLYNSLSLVVELVRVEDNGAETIKTLMSAEESAALGAALLGRSIAIRVAFDVQVDVGGGAEGAAPAAGGGGAYVAGRDPGPTVILIAVQHLQPAIFIQVDPADRYGSPPVRSSPCEFTFVYHVAVHLLAAF